MEKVGVTHETRSDFKTLKGILLHAGHGTRLRPLTHTGPKQLLPIANKPMSQYCIESMKDAGVKEIAIIIGGIGAQKVKDYYEDGKKLVENIKSRRLGPKNSIHRKEVYL